MISITTISFYDSNNNEKNMIIYDNIITMKEEYHIHIFPKVIA